MYFENLATLGAMSTGSSTLNDVTWYGDLMFFGSIFAGSQRDSEQNGVFAFPVVALVVVTAVPKNDATNRFFFSLFPIWIFQIQMVAGSIPASRIFSNTT